jgi:hypothetical protein
MVNNQTLTQDQRAIINNAIQSHAAVIHALATVKECVKAHGRFSNEVAAADANLSAAESVEQDDYNALVSDGIIEPMNAGEWEKFLKAHGSH